MKITGAISRLTSFIANKKLHCFVFILSAWMLQASIPIHIRASDSSYPVIIGFSKDGAFFAFERMGTHDGSGAPFSEIFILNVSKNSYASTPIRFDNDLENATEEITSAQNLKRAQPHLDRVGIVKGNFGTKVFTASTDTQRTAHFHYRGKTMKLILEQHVTQEENCISDIAVYKMTLSLSYKGTVQILQKDDYVPKSRACPFSYAIREVYCYANAIVALVDYQSPGYEGPDLRQIAVTGNLK